MTQLAKFAVLVIQQMPTNCVQANDNNLEVLPHIILYLSTRRPQIIGSRGHIRNTCLNTCLKYRFSNIFVCEDHEFFEKINKKSSKQNSWACTPPYRAVPLPPTKMGAKCLSTVVLDNQDCALSQLAGQTRTLAEVLKYQNSLPIFLANK